MPVRICGVRDDRGRSALSCRSITLIFRPVAVLPSSSCAPSAVIETAAVPRGLSTGYLKDQGRRRGQSDMTPLSGTAEPFHRWFVALLRKGNGPWSMNGLGTRIGTGASGRWSGGRVSRRRGSPPSSVRRAGDSFWSRFPGIFVKLENFKKSRKGRGKGRGVTPVLMIGKARNVAWSPSTVSYQLVKEATITKRAGRSRNQNGTPVGDFCADRGECTSREPTRWPSSYSWMKIGPKTCSQPQRDLDFLDSVDELVK